MFLKRKTILLITLVFLLVIVGYINHQFTKYSLLESSNEYQEYEKEKMSDIQDTNKEVTQSNVDDIKESNTDVADNNSAVKVMTDETNENIEETMSKSVEVENSNYFIEYRISRDKLRADLIERLEEIINNKATDQSIRNEAQKQIITIGKIAEKELFIEGLIKAKGFENVVVFLDENSARVVVSRDELTEQDVMKILEIVMSETELDATQIKIMKKF
ncbi:SpoIIIAH-like family protein [Caldisalinibacter kiritimatiensis]|uniref:Stage III sporulation protein AH n=1 Tax=Caldisalinibacter kiritimatiensis TaxID=1304284 RepID=R1CYS1_9FIRM|nr:SpoIIIAH-like family protein [Caldisalinibacter kiritimatiensis]EOD01734.1 Stage III sporulation protein AH [Caldisalinibacter kiritimatiensis]